jgi:intein/homing endonuclease
MPLGKKNDIVDLTKPTLERVIACDCGTMNLVLAEQKGDKAEFSTIRNMFLELEKDQITMAELSNIDFVESDDHVYIVGTDAFNFGNIFGKQVKRPMSKGLISPNEIDGLDVLALIVEKLVGKVHNGKCIYCIPAPSIDTTNNIVYHEGVFKRIFTNLGYQAESMNEAMAVIYSQCQDEQFTGLAFSFGAGMVNCLSGDTKIKLLDGSTKTIKELADLYQNNEEFWVYSSKEDGTLVPGKAHHPRKTKTVSRMIQVTLDDDSVEECTPEHLWMMRDGSYKEAKDLKENDSLMPLRVKISDKHSSIIGYEMYYDNVTKGWKFTHRMVSESFNIIPSNNHIHHWNFNKLDNTPSNLISMTRENHISLHGVCANNTIERMLGKTFDEIYGIEKSKEIRQKMSNSMKIAFKNLDDNNLQKSIDAIKVWSELITNHTFDEIFGEEISAEIRLKMHLARKGKTFEEFYGEELAKKLKKQKSEYAKQQVLDGTFGAYERTDEWKKGVEHTFFKKDQSPWNKNLDSNEYKSHFDIEKIKQTSTMQWNNEEKRKRLMISKGMVVAKHLVKNNIEITKINYENQRKQMIKSNYGPISYDSWLKYFDSEEQLKETVLNWNHKIKRVEIIEKECDVYDMTVDEYHNFALVSGVFVHNCALAYKSVPVISFSVARAGDWIDEQAAAALGTVANRITKIKETDTNLLDFSIGGKKEKRIREAIVYYYREMIRYSLDQIKNKLIESTGNLDLPDTISVIVSGGTSMASGFLELFKQVLTEYKDSFPIQIKDVRSADDPMTAVAEGLLIKAMSKYRKES